MKTCFEHISSLYHKAGRYIEFSVIKPVSILCVKTDYLRYPVIRSVCGCAREHVTAIVSPSYDF